MRTRQVTNAAILRVSTVTVIEHHAYQTGNYCSYIERVTVTVIEHHVYQIGNDCSYIDSGFINSY